MAQERCNNRDSKTLCQNVGEDIIRSEWTHEISLG